MNLLKKTEVTMFLFIATALAADMFILVGSENRVNADGVLPRAKGIADAPVVEKLSITATFVVATNYAEAYIGPTWKPTEHFSFGIAGGIETADSPWRVAAYSSASYKKLWLLGVVEYGGTGLWYKALASYRIGPVGVGAFLQRFDGLGPRVAGTYKSVELWVAPLYDFESSAPNVLVGLNWTP